jgi:hypothetical protein
MWQTLRKCLLATCISGICIVLNTLMWQHAIVVLCLSEGRVKQRDQGFHQGLRLNKQGGRGRHQVAD